jgi:outer membrane protein TolC
MPKKILHDCATGQTTEVELTAAEIAELDQQRAQYEEEQAQREAKAEALAELKASAKAKLIAGTKLTEEEADAIL